MFFMYYLVLLKSNLLSSVFLILDNFFISIRYFRLFLKHLLFKKMEFIYVYTFHNTNRMQFSYLCPTLSAKYFF